MLSDILKHLGGGRALAGGLWDEDTVVPLLVPNRASPRCLGVPSLQVPVRRDIHPPQGSATLW